METGAVIKHDPENAPKTGDWRTEKPSIDKDKCIGCGACVGHCPEAIIKLEKRDEKDVEAGKSELYAEIDFDYCKGCGVCASICPVNAIDMLREE